MKSCLRLAKFSTGARDVRPALCALALFCMAGAAAAEDSATARPEFERQAVPIAAGGKWTPAADGDYQPLAPWLLDRLLELADAPRSMPDEVALTRSAYRATWRGDDVLSGNLAWEIRSASSAARLFPFTPCRVALSNSAWEGSSPRPAVIGMDDIGINRLLVERSGKLTAEWSLRGTQDVSQKAGALATFVLQLPPCPLRELELDLPSGVEPTISEGVVLAVVAGEDDRRTWQVRLGSAGPVRIELARESDVRKSSTVTLHEERAYRISPRGVELTVLWTLDVHGEPLTELPIVIPAGLELISAVHNGRELARGDIVSDTKLAGDQGHAEKPAAAARCVLHFASPLSGVDTEQNVVRLRAVAPLRAQQAISLPAPSSPVCVWAEGRATVEVAAPLVLHSLDVQGGRVASEFLDGEAEVQFFEGSASLQAFIAPEPSLTDLAIAALVEIAPGDTRCTFRLRARQVRGMRFELLAEIGEGWSITSVDSPNADVADWQVEENADNSNRLKIELSRPLVAGQETSSLELTIAGRRAEGFSDPSLSAADLLMLRYSGLPDAPGVQLRGALAVRAETPFVLQPESALLSSQALALDGFDEDVRTLVGRSADAVLFDASRLSGKLRWTLSPPAKQLRAEVETLAVAQSGELVESYLFSCVPERGPATQVVCLFSAGRSAPLRWSMGGGASLGELHAERLDAALAEGALPAGVEAWKITLDRPRQAPFELRATRASPLHGEMPISLAVLADASRQTARLEIRAAGNEAARVVNLRLEPLWPSADDLASSTRIRGTFAYLPERDVIAAAHLPAAIAIDPAPGQFGTAKPIVRLAVLDTRLSLGASWLHRARLEIEEARGEAISLELPTLAGERLDVRVDGRAAPWRRRGRSLEVSLPEASGPSVLELYFDTSPPSSGLIRHARAPFPRIEGIVARSVWRISFPEEIEVSRIGGESQTKESRRGWLGRLLGPIAATPAAAPHEYSWTGSSPPWEVLNAAEIAIEGAYQGEVEVRIVHVEHLALWGYAGFPLLLLLGWRVGDARRRTAWIVTAVVLVAALLVPDWLTPLTGTLSLAWLAGCLTARLFSRHLPLAGGAVKQSAVAAATVSACGFALWSIGAAVAQEGPKLASDARPMVLCPVDEQGQPLEDLPLFVPRSLHDALRRRVASTARPAQGWIVEAVSIAGRLERLGDESGAYRASLDAQIDFRSFTATRQVEIPFFVAGGVPPRTGRLNGRTVPLAWNAERTSLAVAVDAEGAHRLEIDGLTPRIEGTDRLAGFRGVLPGAPNTRFELAVPKHGPRMEVPSSLGRVHTVQEGRVTRAEVGPAEVLDVRWRPTAHADAVDATTLLVCQVKPGSVVLRGKFHLKMPGDAPASVVLAIHPRLRPLGNPRVNGVPIEVISTPAAASSAAARDVAALSWETLLEIPIPAPATESVEIQADFLMELLPDVAGLGRLQIPWCGVRGTTDALTLVALSVDPALSYQLEQAESVEDAEALEEFASRWGEAEFASLGARRVLRANAGDPLPALSVRASPMRLTARQQTELIATQGLMDVQFDAQLQCELGRVFQYRITVPPAFQPIRLLDVNSPAAELSWSRESETELVVAVPAAAEGLHSLRLTGVLPVPLGEPWLVPRFQVHDAEIEEDLLRVYRLAEVLVRGEGGQPVPLAELNSPTTAPARGRLAAQWDLSATPAARIVVSANAPRVESAVQWLRLRRAGESWSGQLALRMDVAAGLLDEVTFDAPADWRPQPTKELNVTIARSPSDSARRQWQVTTAQPLSGKVALRLNVEPVAAAAAAAALPDIRPGLPAARHYVLPTRIGRESIHWQTSGLLPSTVELPAELTPARDEEVQVYSAAEVLGLVSAERSAGQPDDAAEVRLVRHDLFLARDGNGLGRSEFLVSPRGATALRLKVPLPLEILSVSMLGRAVAPSRVDAETLEVSLATPRWPTLVTMTYRWPLQAAKPRLLVPLVVGADPAETTWRIDSAPAELRLLNGETAVAGQGEPIRRELAAAVALWREALAAESQARQDFAAWFSDWAVLLHQSAQQALRNARTGAVSDDEIAAMEEQLTEAAAAAQAAGLAEAWQSASKRVQPAGENAHAARGDAWNHAAIELVSMGNAPPPNVAWSGAPAGDEALRWVLAAIVIAVAVGSLILQRAVATVLDWSFTLPSLLILIGLMCLWLGQPWPAAIGLAAGALTGLSALRARNAPRAASGTTIASTVSS